MRRKFATLAVRTVRYVRYVRLGARSPGEFIVRINLTFNFPRRVSRRRQAAIRRDASGSETLRFRIIRGDFVADNLFVVQFRPVASPV